MAGFDRSGGAGGNDADATSGASIAAGKRTLTQSVAPRGEGSGSQHADTAHYSGRGGADTPEAQAGFDPSTVDVGAIAAGGRPLDPGARKSLEKKLGGDLSAIMVHTDEKAGAAVAQAGARAFTHQNHIFFAPGMYQPGTPEGLALLAHEVTHFLQGGSTTGTPAGKAPLDAGGGAHEAEADAAAHAMGTQDHLNGTDQVPGDLGAHLPDRAASAGAGQQLGVRERADGSRVHRCISGCTPQQPARQPPTVAEILADGTVQADINAAWLASNPNAPEVQRGQPGSTKMEHNGWILWNPQTGAFSTIALNNGLSTRDSFTMTDRPADTATARVVSFYHTHPNKNSEGYGPDPSPADIGVANWARLPGLVMTHDGMKTFGLNWGVRR